MKEIPLRLGHSPDPDDAFMFYALAQNPPLIPTGPYRFEHVLQDIQTLNQRAMNGELEITAISIHAYPYVSDKYALTSCGSSMGDKYGPMVITRSPMTLDDLRGKRIAIPGKLTTAFLALQLCLGKGVEKGSGFGVQGSGEENKTETEPKTGTGTVSSSFAEITGKNTAEKKTGTGTVLSSLNPDPRTLNPSANPAFEYEVVHFDQIPAHVRDGKADAGLIIHEGQLTFQKLGLHLVVDLGVWWDQKTNLPLPLGGNCIRKDLGPRVMQEVTDILKQSIQYSLDHRSEAVEYALQFGRDLDRNLADQFVGMYVNQWTLDYGPRGREAITRLLTEGAAAGIVPPIEQIELIHAQ